VITGYLYEAAEVKMEFEGGWLGLFKLEDGNYTIVDSQTDGIFIEENVRPAHALAYAIEVYTGRGVEDIKPEINEVIDMLTDELGMGLTEYVEKFDWLKARVDLLEKLRNEASGSKAEEIVLALAAMQPPTNETDKDPDEIWGVDKVDVCAFCGEIMVTMAAEEHAPLCIWRQAREWAEAHKES
jgi:hypothetical protein